jgi:low affinity Fe/Cu permease
MKKKKGKRKGLKMYFTEFSKYFTKTAGSPYTTIAAMLVVVIWALTGPIFGFSDTWQLVINTSTTIITFLMVFIIQQSQNRDAMAMQLKLNELIAANEGASNRLVDIEDLTEDELETLKSYFIKLAQQIKKDRSLHTSHSVEEAEERHRLKLKHQAGKKSA